LNPDVVVNILFYKATSRVNRLLKSTQRQRSIWSFALYTSC